MCIVWYLQPSLVHDLSVRIINAIVIDQCFASLGGCVILSDLLSWNQPGTIIQSILRPKAKSLQFLVVGRLQN